MTWFHTAAAGPRLRLSLILVAAASIVGGTLGTAQAQPPQAPQPAQRLGWDFLVSSGTMVPTGAQRDAVKRGDLTVAQLSYAVRQPLAITASVGWARSRDIAAVGRPKLDLFTYDLGAEFRAPRRSLGSRVTFSPFAAAGAGARSYNYRNLKVDAQHNVSSYVGAGGDLAYGRVGLRLELRDYLTGFTPLDGGGAARARNDVAVMVGLRIGKR